MTLNLRTDSNFLHLFFLIVAFTMSGCGDSSRNDESVQSQIESNRLSSERNRLSIERRSSDAPAENIVKVTGVLGEYGHLLKSYPFYVRASGNQYLYALEISEFPENLEDGDLCTVYGVAEASGVKPSALKQVGAPRLFVLKQVAFLESDRSDTTRTRGPNVFDESPANDDDTSEADLFE